MTTTATFDNQLIAMTPSSTAPPFPGALSITTNGLPSSVSVEVLVTGPDSYSDQFLSPEALQMF